MIKFHSGSLRLILMIFLICLSYLILPNILLGQNLSQTIEDSKSISSNSNIGAEHDFKVTRDKKLLEKNTNNYPNNHQKLISTYLQYNVNDTENFWALDFSKDSTNYSAAYYEFEATVVAISTHSIVFVETTLSSTYQGENGLGKSLSNSFDEIYSKEVPFFGIPSDVDNNNKIIILLLDIRGRTDVAGFFSPLNYFEKSQDPQNISYYSNNADLIYIDVDHVQSSGLATLAHEFQHLIQFNVDDSEDVWLDEGLSMFAEKFTGYDNTISQYITNYSSSGFGYNIDLTLTYWQYESAHYGASYLFLLYLSDRFGPSIISQVSNDQNRQGINSIEYYLKNNNPDLSIEDVFQDWSISLAINDIQNSPYFFFNYSNTVDIQKNWNIGQQNQIIAQNIDHWANDIINLSSSINGKYWLNFLAENSKWLNEFERKYFLNLLQFDTRNSSWIVERLNYKEPISLDLNSTYSSTYLIVSSTTGTSSGFYPADPPKTWYSNYHLFSQNQISTMPKITIESFNETSSKIIIPMPLNVNGTVWSNPIVTDITLYLHSAKTGQIIRSYDTIFWNNYTNQYFINLKNDFIEPGDYFFSSKLISAGQTVILYSLGWTDPNFVESTTTRSNSMQSSNSNISGNVYGFLIFVPVIVLLTLFITRKKKKN